MHANDISFSKVYYTNIKSDSYSQYGVEAVLVGVGSLKVGVAFFFLCMLRAQLYYNPTILKFLDRACVSTPKLGGILPQQNLKFTTS